MTITLRPASAQDSAGIAALMSETSELHAQGLPNVFAPQSEEQDEERIAFMASEPDSAMFVAEDGERIAGLIWVILADAPAKPLFVPRRYAKVTELVVARAYQQRGVGRHLMLLAEQWALARGVSTLQLNVYAFNQNAVAFYDRLGYEPLHMTLIKKLEEDASEHGDAPEQRA